MIGEGVWLADLGRPQCPLVYTNPAFERLTGYAAGELAGRSFAVLQGAHGDPVTFAAVGVALRERRAWSGEVRIARKDGTVAWHELCVTPTADDTGQVRYALGVQVDVTERKNLQECLRRAQKMAAVGWLAGGLAHDFNNLLTPILGYCDLLLTAAPPIPVREGLEEIRRAGEWGTGLIAQLQALCRRQKPQPRTVELPAVLTGIDGLLHCLLPRNVALEIRVDPAPSPIQAAPGQVEQILLNLIRNACDAMPQGGTVTVSVGNTYDGAAGNIPPGSHVVLAVADTGCGMSEEVRAQLFQPLVSTKDADKGSGLGLFMVHDIVRQNGGSITVASRPGRGTRVEIHWPAAAAADPGGAPVQAPATGAGKATILLVDDEPGVREVVRWVLRQQGYTVLEAGNGPDALTIGREHPGPIHLLLTDVVMPQMDAHELVARLAPLRPEMKLVYLSGDCPEEAGDYLPKPFTPESLTRKVREVLRDPAWSPSAR
jgi:PAS domain S-box-containing protein